MAISFRDGHFLRDALASHKRLRGSVRLALDLTSTCGLGLELPGLAGLYVMTAASKLTKNSRLLNLLFERLERPLDAIGVAKLNLYHASSDDRIEKRARSQVGRPLVIRNVSTRSRASLH
jgi:hypothetical protein